MKNCLCKSKTVYLVLIYYFSEKTNLTKTTFETLPGIETPNVTTSKYKSVLKKFFGEKSPQPDRQNKQKEVGNIYDIINNPIRFKRGDNNHFSDFTESYEYKKSTLPIIMDTTTPTNDVKKHLGFADIQPKTTTKVILPNVSKKRCKFKKFLNKVFHKKQKGQQKRDALTKLHRDIRFSPFKHLRKMFQVNTLKKTTKLTDDPNFFTKQVSFNKEDIFSEMEKQLSNPSENPILKDNKGVTNYNFLTKNFPNIFGGFKIQNKQKQVNWKPQKDDTGSKFTSDNRKYSTLKYSPIDFRPDDYIETFEPKNGQMSSYNKYVNNFHQLTTDNIISNDVKLDLNLDSSESSIPFNYNEKTYANAKLDPNAKFYPYSKETNANFGYNTKNSKYETNAQYNDDANNKEVPKYGNTDNNEIRKFSINSGYSSSSKPLWHLKDLTDMDKSLDESRKHSIADTGKLSIKLSLRLYNQAPSQGHEEFCKTCRFSHCFTIKCYCMILNLFDRQTVLYTYYDVVCPSRHGTPYIPVTSP